MFDVIKSVLLIFIEINLYHILGYGIFRVLKLQSVQSFGKTVLYGFSVYHVLFWCIAFPCSLFDTTLQMVVFIWVIVLGICIFEILRNYVKEIKECYLLLLGKILENKMVMIPFLIIVGSFIYFVYVNGQNDIDAQEYIGEVTSMLTTNRLVGIHVVSGNVHNLLHFRRCCSVFGVNSAVLCSIFSIHPLVFCRITRAAINVCILIFGTLELFKVVYKKSVKTYSHAVMATMLAVASLFLFTNTIYTSSRFILFRTYEGKAYCAGALILLAVNVVLDLIEKRKDQYFLLVFMCIITSISISASAVFVIPAAISIMLGTYILVEKKWSYIWKIFLAMTPCIIYLCIMISGLSTWQLEG